MMAPIKLWSLTRKPENPVLLKKDVLVVYFVNMSAQFGIVSLIKNQEI